MDDIVFYTNPMSRGRIARWMLEEVGVPYRTEIVEYGAGMQAPDYLAINPMGKVPTLVHRGTVVTENAAILTFLADMYPEARLAPPSGSAQRGPYYRWMFFAAGPLESAVTNQAMGFEIPPERERMMGYGSYARTLDALAGLFADGRSYALGEAFTALDVFLGSQIAWGLTFGTMEERPGFADYVARITDREAYRRALQMDTPPEV